MPDADDLECSVCEDNLSSREDYDIHVNEHIQEINEIAIESLKGGNELFKCNLCGFQSGQTVTVKDYLKEHVRTTLSSTDIDIASKKRKEKNCQERSIKVRELAWLV